MTAAPIPTDGTTASAPVACSLTTEGLAEQAGRWTRLAARALTGHARTANGLRLDFRPDPGIEEELRALVAVETRCCPWATWTVQASATQLALDVCATGDGVTALHGMFTGLQQAPVPR
jgi:MerR family transcriptional regulator, copper efflux regulator